MDIDLNFKLARSSFPTLLASMVVHAGVWHLANNMFGVAVGRRVIEDWVGHIRFVFIDLASGVAGAGAHALAAVFSWMGTNILGIAAWAHIGGFVAGIVLGLVFRVQPEQRDDASLPPASA